MTVTATTFNTFRKHLVDADVDWSVLTVRAMLVASNTWTPATGDDFVSTALAAGAVELTATGYARQPLSNKTTTRDDANARALIGTDIISFGPVTAGQVYNTLVFYAFVTNDGDSWLICSYNLGSSYATDGTPIVFAPNAAGIAQVI